MTEYFEFYCEIGEEIEFEEAVKMIIDFFDLSISVAFISFYNYSKRCENCTKEELVEILNKIVYVRNVKGICGVELVYKKGGYIFSVQLWTNSRAIDGGTVYIIKICILGINEKLVKADDTIKQYINDSLRELVKKYNLIYNDKTGKIPSDENGLL